MNNKKDVIHHIVNWIEEYGYQSNTKGFVVGISGGIDSSVTSCLLAETGRKILCLSLPIHQHKDEIFKVKKITEFLQSKYSNVSTLEVDLSEVFDSFKNVNAPKTGNKNNLALALANSRSRLRMTTLYYYAGLNNYLVVGTGNKIEDFGIGFFTKYGDGGVDISPIADLLKSEVYELAKEFGIPEIILNSAPTDGLFVDNRTDEQQIGATYDELEWAMSLDEKNINYDTLTGRQKEILEIYKRLNIANKHKIIPIPFCRIPKNY